MQEFTNETIDISTLPKFEEVQLNSINPKYFRIILVNISIFFGILFLAFTAFSFLQEDFFPNRVWLIIGTFLPLLYGFIIVMYYFSFKKRGYAFREHDVIYKSGLIRESTIIVPNNRVQHVALHQGFFSRMFGLAAIELFTAGGSSSDLEISGLVLAEAQKIKNMISIKINTNLEMNESATIIEEIILNDATESLIEDENKEGTKNED